MRNNVNSGLESLACLKPKDLEHHKNLRKQQILKLQLKIESRFILLETRQSILVEYRIIRDSTKKKKLFKKWKYRAGSKIEMQTNSQ